MTDAVVIGSGPNGLVAANLLADAGWSVLVLEAQPTVGGAVKTDTDVAAGFRHDTFSAFYPLGLASPWIKRLDLEAHGLVWTHAPAVLGHPLPDGRWAMVHRDRHDTAAALDGLCPGDGFAWLRLCSEWDRFGPDLIDAILQPFPSGGPAFRVARQLPAVAGLSGLALPLSRVRRLAEARFRGEGARLLLAGNALHADLRPDDPGSGLFGLLLAMLAQTVGFPAPVGGASGLTDALVRRLESRGAKVQTDAEVVSVLVRDGAAVGVRLADGTTVEVSRAVIATVSAPTLFGGLVPTEDLPTRVRRGMRRFVWDPATVKVDWALSAPAGWEPPPTLPPGTIHLADSMNHLSTYADQVRANAIPADPMLLVGQMSTTDPSRSPAGTEALWAYCHVPQQTSLDAGAGGIRGVWDHDDCERMADRMQAQLARRAPGFESRVLARRVLGPRELEGRDANLGGGAIGGGTARLRQQLFLRPVPGAGNATTGIDRLFLGSAAAHPGGGVHGACGGIAATAAMKHQARPA